MDNERKFKNGNIISLYLTNFQTFKSSRIRFSPSLNFIIGPNGSGKSTISNALSLIFGGTPKTIGKTKNLKEYIRFGAHDCKIEAEVFYEGEIYKIGRGISIANNFWYVNGEIVKKGIYEQFISKFNVDVNNLCQYLPQEKVAEFCRMSNEELLYSTLTSLKRQDLLENITFINDVETKLNDTNTKELALIKQKEEMQLIVEKITNDVEKLNERDIKKKKIDIMESKKMYLEYETMVSDYKRLDQGIKTLENNLKANNKEIEDINKSIENIEKNPKNVLLNNKIDELDTFDDKLKNIKKNILNEMENLSLLDIDLEHLNKKREQRNLDAQILQQKIESSKEEIEKIKQCILDKMEYFELDEEDFSIKRAKCDDLSFIFQARNLDNLFVKFDKTKINKLEDEKFKFKNKAFSINQKCFDIKREVDALEERKKKFSEAEERRLEQLKKYSFETYKGVVWLREHKGQFKDEIIEPPFLNITISDQRFVNEIEVFLSYHALTSFICKNQEDFEKLSRILKDELNLGINIVEAIKNPPSNYYSTEEVKKIGFDGLAIDFIDACREVKDFLKASCYLNNIPITKKNINDKYIFETTSFKRIAMDGKYIEIRRSKYNSKDFVISSFVIKTKNLFSSKIDTSDIEKRLMECNEFRRNYNEELKVLHQEIDKIDYKLKKCYDESKEHTNQIIKIKTNINNYKSLIEQTKTLSIELKKAEDKQDLINIDKDINRKKKLIKNNLTNFNKEIILILKDSNYLVNFKEGILIYKEIKTEFSKLQSLLNSKNAIERQNTIIQSNITEHTTLKERLKPEIVIRKEALKTKTYTRVEMETVPNTTEELIKEIRTETAQLKFYDVDDNLKHEYLESKNNLDKLIETINKLENDKKSYNENILNKKQNTCQQISETIERINTEFIELFSKLGCQGRIEFEHVDKLCKQWKLNILVKFRETEKLEKLNSFRQSGGEKSVSTILYLLALQKIDTAPFRLVDEINQGMDKYNEKLVLEMLFDICEKDESTQFFIISPKLVEGLKYNKNMNIIVLFSDQSDKIKEAFK